MFFYEELEIGQRREVGAYTFTAEAIKRFAAKYDPQRFHLDEEEGRKSLLGGLAASGWHAAAGGAITADVDFLNRETSAFLDAVTEGGRKLN